MKCSLCIILFSNKLSSLNVFSGAEAPNRAIRIISLSVLTLSISGILRFFIGRMADNKALTKRTGVAIIELLGNLVKYVAILVLVFLVLSALGVDTTGLLASLGILGLILGLGVTSLIEDIVAGIFIIAEHLFDVGDIVVVDGFRGTVESIGIRSTQFRDVGSDVLIMRNSSIGSLVNLTRNASGAAITIPLAPEENLERVEKIIENAQLDSIKAKYPIIDGGPFYLGPCEVTPRGVKNLLFVAGCKEEVKYDVQRIQYREVIELFERNGIKLGALDPIEIGTLEELKKIGVDGNYPLSGDYILTADIDGMDAMINGTFSGTFDGDGHTITMALYSTDYQTGLFCLLSGTVKNLKTDGSVTTTVGNASAIASTGEGGGRIENCWNAARIVGETAGGMVGGTGWTTFTVENCLNTGSVTFSPPDMPNQRAAGISGLNGGVIRNCYSSSAGIAVMYDKGTVPGSYYSGDRGRDNSSATQLSGAAITSEASYSGWDFDNVWIMTDDGPMLRVFYTEVVYEPHVHEEDEMTFQPWTAADSLPGTAGSWYLTADVTIDSTWSVPSDGTTNLCLGGHGITRTNAGGTTGSVIQVGGGAVLNLHDCDGTTHYYTVANPAGNGAGLGTVCDEAAYNAADENARGTFTGGYITGGVISGGVDKQHLIGGGVNVAGGAFRMFGGTIIGNRTCINSGGVKVKGAGASFAMYGGAIIANLSDYYGGAISVGDNGSNRLCTVTISGGTIERNWSGANAGAIHFDGYSHTVAITGRAIVNNHTNGNYKNGSNISYGRSGGGTLTASSKLTVSGNPIITGNTSILNEGSQSNNMYMASTNDVMDLSGHLSSGADIGVYVKGVKGDSKSVWPNADESDFKIGTGADIEDIRYIRFDVPSEAVVVYCDGETDWVYRDGDFTELYGAHHAHEAGTVWASSAVPAAIVTGGGTEKACSFAGALGVWTDGTTLKLLKNVELDSPLKVITGTKTLDLNGYGIINTSSSGRILEINNSPTAVLTIADSSEGRSDRPQHQLALNADGRAVGVYARDESVPSGAAEVVTVAGGFLAGGYDDGNGACMVIDAGGTVILTGGTIVGNRADSGAVGVFGGTFIMRGGTITGDTTLVAQWAPLVSEETPDATFTATGADCGELSGLIADAAYVLSGAGLEEETITADESGVHAIASGLTVGTLTLVKTGNGRTTSDSEARSLAVTRADTPELTVTQPKSADGMGGVDATAAHEYSADNGESWTDCAENQELASGGYLVRVKASGVVLASEPQSVVITTFLEGEGSVSYDMQGNTVTTVLDVSGDSVSGVRVGSLDLEAQSIGEGADAPVTVTMSVASVDSDALDETVVSALQGAAGAESTLEYLSITVQKTEGSSTTAIAETANVLEIIAPYSVSKLANIQVSRCSGGEAEPFTELTDEPETKADGTYRIDEKNGLIYIYTKQSSAYAISYTPCYYVKGSIQSGDDSQEITVALLDADKQPTEYQLVAAREDGFLSYSFPKVPQGTYYLQLSWTEHGVPVSCEKIIEVR